MSDRYHVPRGPTVSVEQALASETARADRDRQLAAWCDLAEDEVGPFLRRLALFDLRERARQERQALEEAVGLAERRRAVLRRVEGWGDTLEGMIARIDAVIADLDDQLHHGDVDQRHHGDVGEGRAA